MQHWEYLFVVAEVFDYAYRVRTVNDREERDWFNGPPVSVYANQLGSAGWELIAVVQGPPLHLTFKRPIEG